MCDEGLVNLDQLLDLNKPDQGMVDATKALTEQIKKYGDCSVPDNLISADGTNPRMVNIAKVLTTSEYGQETHCESGILMLTKDEVDSLLDGPYTDEELKELKDKKEMTALSIQKFCEKLGIAEADVAALINEFNYDRRELARDETSQADVTLLLAVLKLLKGTTGRKAVEILNMATHHIKNEIEQAQRNAGANYTIGNKHE